jgi:uncharacterized protein with von Willebrand factor type A (vWA) domain
MRAVVALAAALMATGCVQAITESRVESALLDAGLSKRNASCMAERMVDRLTISQLRKLERLQARPGERDRPISIGDYLDRVRRVGDAEVIAVTSTSAGLCAIGIG